MTPPDNWYFAVVFTSLQLSSFSGHDTKKRQTPLNKLPLAFASKAWALTFTEHPSMENFKFDVHKVNDLLNLDFQNLSNST